jgi:excisionase family DNA binding protein
VNTVVHEQWLSLGEASELLGVHASTLRRWADSGRVPCQRTPGGHRRFSRHQLATWVEGTQQAPAAAPATGTQIEERPWYRRLVEQGVAAELRPLGQRLSGITVQFLMRRGDDERYLAEAQDLGRQYGARLRGAGVGLSEVVEAFGHYRGSLVPVVVQMIAADASGGLAQMLRFEQVMNQALLGVISEYDQ